MTLSPGTRLRPYEILAPIGAGGMGKAPVPIRVHPPRRLSAVAGLGTLSPVPFLSGRPFTPYDRAVSTAERRGVYDDDLRGLLTSLADGRTAMADHGLAHRRSEP